MGSEDDVARPCLVESLRAIHEAIVDASQASMTSTDPDVAIKAAMRVEFLSRAAVQLEVMRRTRCQEE